MASAGSTGWSSVWSSPSAGGRAVVAGAPRSLRFVLGHGVPAVIEVAGDCMAPSLPRGAHVPIAPVAPNDPIEAGDLVVLETESADVLLLHRVIHLFEADGGTLVIHQGDAPRARPGVSERSKVIGRAAGTPVAERGRFLGRRLVALAYARARLARDFVLDSAGRALRFAVDLGAGGS